MRHHRRPIQATATRRCRQHTDTSVYPPAEPAEVSWLLPGEAVHAEIEAHAWRYLELDVPYGHRTILFGGPVGWICSGIASAIGNRRTRRAAQRLAAAQWRYLGHLPILVTNQRLLVWYQHDWWPVWFNAVSGWRLDDDRLEIHFLEDPPYLLSASDAPIITSALSTHLDPAGVEAGPR